ncbi:MAG TPA: GAF domain-containing protein, partial [Polyangiaceae bacterium]
IVHVSIKEREPKFISRIREEAPYLLQPREDSTDTRPRFVEREGIQSCAILVLKTPPDGEVVGCLFVNYAEQKDFGRAENRGLRQLAISVASAVAVGIKIARLHGRIQHDLQRSRDELKALRAVNRSIAKNLKEPDVQQTCSEVLKQAQDVLGVEVGDVTIWNPQERLLEVVSQRGYPCNSPMEGVRLGVGVVGMVGRTKKPARFDSVADVPNYKCVHPQTQSEMTYPMLDLSTENLLGVINVEHHKKKAFSERDEEFLRTLAVQGAIAIHTLYAHERLQLQLRNARCLAKVAARIQWAQSEQDQHKRERTIFSVLLTGLTAKQGLGFSRALLFLPEPSGCHCRGAMARGAMSLERAQENWQRLLIEERDRNPDEFLDELLDRAASEAVNDVAVGDELTSVVKGLTLELPAEHKTLRSRWAEHANQPEFLYTTDNHPLGVQLQCLYPDDKRRALALVPIGRDTPVALIVLDRCFIHDEQVIDPLYEAAIRAFAELAATSIESSRVRALRDTRWAAHAIAHSLKKTFLSMQQESGTISGLLQSTLARKPELSQRLNCLGSHFKAMSDLLEDIDAVGQPKVLHREEFELTAELHAIVETHQTVYRSCPVKLNLPNSEVILTADRSLLKRMVLELWSNADRALVEDLTRTPEICINVHVALGNVELSVQDNGPGIAAEIVGRQYDPFISGYRSSGVGLAIVHDSVVRHGGRIDYTQLNPGAQFTVTLPLKSHESTPAPPVASI